MLKGFVDSHCHLFKEYYDNIEEEIINIKESGVTRIIVSACSPSDVLEVMELSKKYDAVYLTIGFHPDEAKNITEDDLKELSSLINDRKVVGIGEIGLDYHYSKDEKESQEELFRKQLDIALENNMSVVIHSRDATLDTIRVLKDYKVKGIIHCFSGSLETAKTYIEMGYKLGIGGVLTFKNSNLTKVVENISLEDIVLETDSPYLSPEPFRGKKNSPKNIPIIAKKIAQIKNVDASKVMEITTKNCLDLFDLN